MTNFRKWQFFLIWKHQLFHKLEPLKSVKIRMKKPLVNNNFRQFALVYENYKNYSSAKTCSFVVT